MLGQSVENIRSIGGDRVFSPATMGQTQDPKFRGWMSALRFLSPQPPMLPSFKLPILVIFNIL